MTALFEARGLGRDYAAGGSEPVVALDGIDLTVEEGDLVVVAGASGSGKTTLLALLAGLDVPTRGEVLFRGEDLVRATPGRRAELRRRHMGFVFQDFRLVRHLSARENVRLPLLFAEGAGRANGAADGGVRRAEALLERVGIADRAGRRPDALSRGEMQRAAVARALVHRPAVVFADEPTASLDAANGAAVWELLLELRREEGVAVIAATHDVLPAGARVVHLVAGRLKDA